MNGAVSFQVRATIARGPLANGTSATWRQRLTLANRPSAPPPVRLTMDRSAARYRFDGFGGNYCWNNAGRLSRRTRWTT